jgi:hypothetical protein
MYGHDAFHVRLLRQFFLTKRYIRLADKLFADGKFFTAAKLIAE